MSPVHTPLPTPWGEGDHSLLRFYLPAEARWAVVNGREAFAWPAKEKPRDIGEHRPGLDWPAQHRNPSGRTTIRTIPIARVQLDEREIEAVKRVLRSGRLRTGLRTGHLWPEASLPQAQP